MSRLSASVDHVTALLTGADLAADATVRELLRSSSPGSPSAVLQADLRRDAGPAIELARISTAGARCR